MKLKSLLSPLLMSVALVSLAGCPDKKTEEKIEAEQNRIGHAPKDTIDGMKAKAEAANAKAAERLEELAPAEDEETEEE